MSDNNPYKNADEDADIFEEIDKVGSEDGEGDAGKQVFRTPDGVEIPPEVADQLKEYGITSPFLGNSEGSSSMPPEFLMVGHLFGYLAQWTYTDRTAPLVTAVAEVLDEISDGKVRRLTEFYECERELLYTHSILYVINFVIKGLSPFLQAGDSPYVGEITLYLETYGDFFNYTRLQATKNYRRLGEELGHDIDEDLIDSGNKSSRTSFQGITFGSLIANEETDGS